MNKLQISFSNAVFRNLEIKKERNFRFVQTGLTLKKYTVLLKFVLF